MFNWDFLLSFILVSVFGFAWILVALKSILFWLYLWQLKEYHIGRFLDHFKTHKGRRALLNGAFLAKAFLFIIIAIVLATDSPDQLRGFYHSVYGIILLALLGLFTYFGLLFLYIFQAVKASLSFFRRDIKGPVFTKKALFLFSIPALFSVLMLFLVTDVFYLVLFDLLIPVIVSVIALAFQPIFVLGRNRILKKARQKISGFKNLTVVGITGSYGKTSAKEFLATILAVKFNVLATPEHKNSEMGIAQTILQKLNEKHHIFVVEMGAYKKGGISLLCDIVKPKIGWVTGVNEQHLSLFGSMENLLSAEGGKELLSSLSQSQSNRGSSTKPGPSGGLLVVNGDNKHCLNLYKSIEMSEVPIARLVYSFDGKKIESDIWAEEISVHNNSLDFMVITKEKETAHFNVKVLGRQNIQNLLGAILVARELGMNLKEISSAAKNIKQEQGSITLKNGIHGISVIDSSYSSNPDGVMADIDYLNVFPSKKIIVMPCLIELGKESAEVHRQIGKKMAEVCNMAVITTKDKFEEIKNGAVQNGMAEKDIIFSENPEEIFNLITTSCKKGDAILLEGRVPKEVIKLLVKS